jgi:hypothetical protein
MTNPDQLKVAMPVHVAQVVAHALLHDGRRRVRDADAVVARIVAERLVEHLRLSGYVMMKKADGAEHVGPGAKARYVLT